ncbi:coiled-coil domain-containing protein [Purpureocillium lavendulum]|uniref:Coiled-coil domain-containing protein n=1 Tax=Purpureocillium lavendulum TaxID=1247861 RepID=A0AB34FNE2_9HYPO|nr:coiled-coil domain-containing protein [Purpureocillium lavendulum]
MLRRHDSLRSVGTDTTCVPQIQVSSPPKKVKPVKMREPRDTGFPEPFNERGNTTLPHPDADLSPDAMISHEDVAGERALKRHRLSFLSKRKRTISHGFINEQTETLYSGLALPLMMGIDSAGREHPQLVSRSTWSLRLSKDGGESIRSSRRDGDYDDETPPTSPDISEHRGSKKGLFRRLRAKS